MPGTLLGTGDPEICASILRVSPSIGRFLKDEQLKSLLTFMHFEFEVLVKHQTGGVQEA